MAVSGGVFFSLAPCCRIPVNVQEGISKKTPEKTLHSREKYAILLSVSLNERKTERCQIF